MMIEFLRERFNRADVIRLASSVVLALLLWGWVTSSQDPERERTIPNVGIGVGSLPGNLQVVTSLPTANVTLRGPRSVVSGVNASQIRADLDLDDVGGAGEYTVPVRINGPEGIWEYDVTPRQLSILIEETKTEQVRITTTIEGQSNDAVRARANPEVSEATVSGPMSAVDRVDSVVLPVDLGNQVRNFEASITPVALDADGQSIPEVMISPNPIQVSVEVSARGKSVAVIPQLVGEPAQGYEVVDRQTVPPTVLVDGPEELLNDLVAVQTEPVDISGVTATASRRTRLIGIPEGIRLLEPQDGFVDVVVAIRQRGVRQPLPGQTVTIVNLQPGLSAEVSPREIVIQVVAPEAVVTDLPGSEVEVQIDVSGLGPGTYTLAPKVVLPPNVQWISTDPQTVVVTIQEGPSATPAGTPVATPLATPTG
jgi:YbbR domain-containing protein